MGEGSDAGGGAEGSEWRRPGGYGGLRGTTSPEWVAELRRMEAEEATKNSLAAHEELRQKQAEDEAKAREANALGEANEVLRKAEEDLQ